MLHTLKTWFDVRADALLHRQKGRALLMIFAGFAGLALMYAPYVLFMPAYEGRRLVFLGLLAIVELFIFVCMACCRRGYIDASITLVLVSMGLGVWGNSIPLGEMKSSMFALVLLNLLGGFAMRRRQIYINVGWSSLVVAGLIFGLWGKVDTKILLEEMIRMGCLVFISAYLARELGSVHEQVVHAYESRRDLTRQKMEQVQEQREIAEAESVRAEQASAMKGDFLANISHELRTPLNAILGYSEMLYEEFDDRQDEHVSPTLLEDTKRVHVAGRHLLELIQDVLNLADIESGELKMKSRHFDLDELIEEVVLSMTLSATMQHNTLTFEPEQRVGQVYSDPVWVRQVLFNVLSNAVKFTQQGHITVSSGIDAQTEHLFICVKDTGIGMSEQEQARVFEEFVQANEETLREFGGTGLGLALCYKLARQMDGALSMESVKGEGTCVTFSFPAQLEERG